MYQMTRIASVFRRIRNRALLPVCLCMMVTACSTQDSPIPSIKQFPSPVTDGTMSLYFGPSVKSAALEVIRGARHVCDLTMYELDDQDIIRSLEDAHDRGVSVKVIVDATVASSLRSADELSHRGIPVHRYHVSGGISHIKSLWADRDGSSVELIGGMNFGAHSWNNNDASILIHHAGPEFGALFAHDWAESVGVSAPDVQSSLLSYDRQIKSQILSIIRDARQSILMEAFDLTDRDVINQLISAQADRGVHVRVLLEPTQYPNVRSAQELRNAGVPVRYYTPNDHEWLHAKIVTVDHRAVVIGSANFSHQAFYVNHEGDIVLRASSRFAEAVQANFEACWQRAQDIR